MPRSRDLVIECAFAVTQGPAGIVAGAEIVIRAGRIAAVRRASRRPRPNSERVDRRGSIAIPALVNAHLHSEFLLLKGLLEQLRLVEWEQNETFNRVWSWVRDPANVGHVRNAYRASYLQSALGGVGFVAEFNCADAATEASIEALAESGIRGIATVDLGRRAQFPSIEARGCLYALDDEEGLTEDELGRARELLASRDGVLLTMHAAETSERMVLVRARLGRTTVDLLDSRGLLGPHLLLSHAIHVTPDEIRRLAETRTRVVSSPVAEMKLADGVAPVSEMLSLGIPVSLGTDAAVCNNSSDLFQEMKAASLLQKVTRGAHALPAEQALLMGTLHGARAFGLAGTLGTLEDGKWADLALVDGGSPRLVPLIHNRRSSNVVANLVFSATASDVTDLYIEGEPVVRARRHLRLAAGPIWQALQASAEAMHHALG